MKMNMPEGKREMDKKELDVEQKVWWFYDQ